MLSEPFKILKEKIPFVEYTVRVLQLIAKPDVEAPAQLQTGKMKFALWDIFLSISLFATILGLLGIYNPKADLVSSLSAFSSQFIILLEFGYCAYFSTFSFFIISLVSMLVFRPAGIHPIKGAYLISLHYARCYALFLFFFIPLVAIYIHFMFTELLSISEFTNTYSSQSWIFLIFSVCLYVWCCVIPIKRFWSPFKNGVWSYLLVILVTNLALSSNTLAPKLGALELNQEKACSLFMKSKKVKALSQEQKKKFNRFCLDK